MSASATLMSWAVRTAALAVQNILGDLFASLSIAVDKPFEVGDSIAFQSVNGTVEHIGLKTRIRSITGEQVVISNTEFLKQTIRTTSGCGNGASCSGSA